jgi:hypothetical protein
VSSMKVGYPQNSEGYRIIDTQRELHGERPDFVSPYGVLRSLVNDETYDEAIYRSCR